MTKTIPILGTAMWGWTTEKAVCFTLLDEFYARGFRRVDAATNYPINKQVADFRKAENILLEWIKTNGVNDLEVMMKVGSVNNLRTPEVILNKSFLLLSLDDYKGKFGHNLHNLTIHWDNRKAEAEILDTFDFLGIAHKEGLRLGLSGIRYPEIYARVNEQFAFDFDIQIKHNLLHSDYDRYKDFHGKRRFLAYGMNAGGIKLEQQFYTPSASLKARGWDGHSFEIVPKLKELLKHYNKDNARPFTRFYECGLLFAMQHPEINGVLIGTSRLEQLQKTLDLMEEISSHDFSILYDSLVELSRAKHYAK